MIRRGPRPGSRRATRTAARSRTSVIETAAVRVGMAPLAMNRAMPSPVSPNVFPAAGPMTPLGYTIATGAPAAWSPRAATSACDFALQYAKSTDDGGWSTVSGPASGSKRAAVLETWTTGSSPISTACSSTVRAPAAFFSITSALLRGSSDTTAAQWITASAPSRAAATAAGSVMSPTTWSGTGRSNPAMVFARRSVDRTSARTSCPASTASAAV